jgi:DNA-binding response OmpR family regulator
VVDLSAATPALVLIVEDEGPIAQALVDIVEECGYVPLVAANGTQALERIQERPPSLIITDWMMPLMSGIELIAAVQKQYTYQGNRPPIILMSAAEHQLVHQSGADAILPKPFGVAEVEALLRKYLAQDLSRGISSPEN